MVVFICFLGTVRIKMEIMLHVVMILPSKDQGASYEIVKSQICSFKWKKEASRDITIVYI